MLSPHPGDASDDTDCSTHPRLAGGNCPIVPAVAQTLVELSHNLSSIRLQPVCGHNRLKPGLQRRGPCCDSSATTRHIRTNFSTFIGRDSRELHALRGGYPNQVIAWMNGPMRLRQGGRSSSFSGTCCTTCNMFLKKIHNVPRCHRQSRRLGLTPGRNRPHRVTRVSYTRYAVGVHIRRISRWRTSFASGRVEETILISHKCLYDVQTFV